MAFSAAERSALATVKGVGPTVIRRFEEIGLDSFALLAQANPRDIAEQVASRLGTTCWKNSPQAQAAIKAAIARASQGV